MMMFTCLFWHPEGQQQVQGPLPSPSSSCQVHGFHVSGCWVWSAPGSALGVHPSREPSASFQWCHTRLCVPPRAGRCRMGGQHDQGTSRGCGCSGELQHQQSCTQTSAPPRRWTHGELTRTTLTQPWAHQALSWGTYKPLSPSSCCWKPKEVQEVNQGTWAGARVTPRVPLAPRKALSSPVQNWPSWTVLKKRQAQNLMHKVIVKIFPISLSFPLNSVYTVHICFSTA